MFRQVAILLVAFCLFGHFFHRHARACDVAVQSYAPAIVAAPAVAYAAPVCAQAAVAYAPSYVPAVALAAVPVAYVAPAAVIVEQRAVRYRAPIIRAPRLRRCG